VATCFTRPTQYEAQYEIVCNLSESLQSHYASLEKSIEELNDPSHDAWNFLDLSRVALRFARDPEACRKYLQKKGLHTYGDMREMHDRIMTYLELSEDELKKLIEPPCHRVGGLPPELAPGPYLPFFHCWDFLFGIGVIPDSPDPEHPTLLGLYLSVTQSILRDERMFISSLPHSDMMHLNLIMGVLAHIPRNYLSCPAALYSGSPRPAVEPESYGKLNFENFTITNAILFPPEQVLLTGYQTLCNSSSAATYEISRQIMYNVFTPDKSAFYPSPELSSPRDHLFGPEIPFNSSYGLLLLRIGSRCQS
jgi:hypothetical protein